MNESTPANRFAPPQAHIDEPVLAEGLQLATRWQRFGAAWVDGMFALGVAAAVMLPMYGTQYFHLMTTDKSKILGGLALYLSIFYVVEGWFLYQRNQSLGKMALGLRIVRADGQRPSFARIFGARLLAFGALGHIPVVGPFIGLFDALFIFGSGRRCLHDRVADTIVVTAASAPLSGAAA